MQVRSIAALTQVPSALLTPGITVYCAGNSTQYVYSPTVTPGGFNIAASAKGAWVPQPTGAQPFVQMIGCRTGENGAFGGYTSTNFCGVFQSRHILPYGADSIQVVYAGFGMTTASSFQEVAYPPSVWSVIQGTLIAGAGGTSYAVGDTVTGPTANAVQAWIGRVLAVSSGAITKMAVIRPGLYWGASPPADAMAQSATSGTGSTATFNAQWAPWAAGGHMSIAPNYAAIGAPLLMIGAGASELASQGGAYSDMTQSWDLLIPGGDILVTEPIPVDIAPGAAIGLRGELLSFNAGTGRNVLTTESAAIGASFFERANGGTLTLSQANALYQPAAIIGLPKITGPSMLILGDSRAYGYVGSLPDTGDADGNIGWLERALLSQIPFANHARGSGSLANLINATPPALSRWGIKRVLQASRPSTVYLNLCINDFISGTSAATVQSWEQQMVSWLRAHGVKCVWTDTCDPNTTSSDSWATLANQTITAGGAKAQTRNASLRSLGAGGYAGYDFFTDGLGITEAIVGGAPSGLWVPNSTTDGIHAGQSVMQSKAAAASPIIFASIL